MMDARELSIVESAEVQFDSDHQIWICIVRTRSGPSYQALAPCFTSESTAREFGRQIAQLFGADSLAEIAGRECYVLRAFGHLNDTIEGLEVDGERFTLTGWRRQLEPDAPSVLERRRSQLADEILSARARLDRLVADYRNLGKGYTEWTPKESD